MQRHSDSIAAARLASALVAGLCCLAIIVPARADHPSAGFGGVGAGPINTIGGGVLERGQAAYTVRMEYLNLSRFSDAKLEAIGLLGEEVDSTDYTTGVFISGAWGITDRLTVGVRLPYLYMNDIREPEDDMGMIEVVNEGDSAGHGDILVMSQWQLFSAEEHRFDVSLTSGLEFPSGFTSDVSREGEVFELEHQPGSGSWDPMVGLASTKTWDRLSLHANVLYSIVTEGKQETDLGDIIDYNVAFAYRLWEGHTVGVDEHHDYADQMHHDHDHNVHVDHGPSLDIILEFNGIWQDKQVVSGVRDNNSGGNVIFVAPGARLNFGSGHSLFVSTGFPMAQDVNGFEHETDFRLIVGASLVH